MTREIIYNNALTVNVTRENIHDNTLAVDVTSKIIHDNALAVHVNNKAVDNNAKCVFRSPDTPRVVGYKLEFKIPNSLPSDDFSGGRAGDGG